MNRSTALSTLARRLVVPALTTVGLLLSLAGFLLAHDWDRQRRQADFDRRVGRHEMALTQGIEQNLGSVWALAALFDASEKVSRDEFNVFAHAALTNSPGMIAAEWTPRVTRKNRRAFEQAMRDEISGFRLLQFGAHKELINAGERDEHFPVVYLEPYTGNEAMLGFDMGFAPERLNALNQARDSGRLVASPPLIPVQENQGRYGFLGIYPVYAEGVATDTVEQRRAHCIGFAIGVFRIETLVERALGILGPVDMDMDLDLYDKPPGTLGSRLLYRRRAPPADTLWARFAPEPAQRVIQLHFAGQHWPLVLQSRIAPYTEPSFWLPWLVLLTGVGVTTLLTAYTRQIIERSRVIEAEVSARTHDVEQSRETLAATLQDLRLSEGRLRNILDTVLDGIVTANKAGIIQSINPAIERIFGYAAHEMLGRNLAMLMPEPYHSHHDGYLCHYLDTGERKIIGQHREVEGLRKNGEVFPLELSVCDIPLGDGEHVFIGIVRDISERKRIERIKSEFVSTVSHELRTPLTAIRGALGLLTGGAVGMLAEPAGKLLDIATNNCERLVRLINDILDMEKIESGKISLQLQPLELIPLMRQAIEANQAYALQLGVGLRLSEPLPDCRIQADSDRFMQIMANLLSNAAKFSPRGESVEVNVVHHDKGVRITVADRGPGISESFRPRLFQKFAQADSSDTRQKGGTGLGLSITKALIDRFGGHLDYDSEIGQGTRFYVDLPVLTSAPQAALEPCTNLRPAILVVEDDVDVAHLLCLMLEKQGFTTDIAHDATEAKTLLARKRYSALTLDLMLSGQSGQSLLGELRRRTETAYLPVVVVSAIADQAKRELNGEAVAVVDWLGKPIDENRLTAAVKSALSRLDRRKPVILHVEDDPDIVHVVGALLDEGIQTRAVSTLSAAKAALAEQTFDLVILDIGLPDGSGLDLLPWLSEANPPTPVIIFSGQELGDERIRGQVSAHLVKSKTENLRLVETIRALIVNQDHTAT